MSFLVYRANINSVIHENYRQLL